MQHKDPVTNDPLTTGEWVSWKIQGVIRRWLFLGIITLLTAYVWIVSDPVWHHPVTDQWNLWASYLAIAIESVTAMALINQTRRDAAVIREVRATSKDIKNVAEAMYEVLGRVDHVEQQNHQQLEQIDALLTHAKTGVLPEGTGE